MWKLINCYHRTVLFFSNIWRHFIFSVFLVQALWPFSVFASAYTGNKIWVLDSPLARSCPYQSVCESYQNIHNSKRYVKNYQNIHDCLNVLAIYIFIYASAQPRIDKIDFHFFFFLPRLSLESIISNIRQVHWLDRVGRYQSVHEKLSKYSTRFKDYGHFHIFTFCLG